jgi:hypothetical protein
VPALLVVAAHVASDARQCSTAIRGLGTPFSAAC